MEFGMGTVLIAIFAFVLIKNHTEQRAKERARKLQLLEDAIKSDNVDRDLVQNLAASLAATGELVKDLWGHLPERQRQQILQPLSEDFLPKYATEIEEYFRALADPDRRPPESP